MVDNLQALIALAETGTMTKAATRLHLSQSAISKRIQSLQAEVGKNLIERHGRHVTLTHQGLRLLERARPLIAELREVVAEEVSEARGTIVMSVSESLLYSYGAKVLRRVQQRQPDMELQVNSHSCRLALDKVASGEYMIALTPGLAEQAPDLGAKLLVEEPMVIIPSGLESFSFPKSGKLPIITAPLHQTTWASIGISIKRLLQQRGIKLEITQTIQTYSGVLKLAESGFGHGLVPIGVARAFKIPEKQVIALPNPGVARAISIVGRHSTLKRPLMQRFEHTLREELQRDPLFKATLRKKLSGLKVP